MKAKVVYNRKTGQLGLKTCIGDRGSKDKNWGDGTTEWGSNYAVFLLDPVLFTYDYRNRVKSDADWRQLPKTDPRVQFMTLFHTIEEGADWFYSGYEQDDTIEVEEAYIQNKHEVYKQIKDIF